ncbi:2820_t:CDS:2 [Acaulospora morrowiae]|uniref:2820_t:CDS:1 n=1 Tax=Acaulospora morrowiae TaxID=94023 RepID=A0A9N9DBM4_9GLOM|nr:2820_t:CDS:2 [Acaulospora morrowiae]
MLTLPRQALRHSRASVVPEPSPVNKSSIEKNEAKQIDSLAARRYCTYDLNWKDYGERGMDDKKGAPDMNIPKNPAPNAHVPLPQIHLTPQKLSNERRTEKFAQPFGGITVTVMQKVEINSNDCSRIPRPVSVIMQRKDHPVQRWPRLLSSQIRNDNKSDLMQKVGSLDTSDRFNAPKIMVNAPTSNPGNSNDPTDMEDEDAFSTVRPVTPPKLIHATLVPLEQFRKIKFTEEIANNTELVLDGKRERSLFDKRAPFEHGVSVRFEQDEPKSIINSVTLNNRVSPRRKLSRANSKRKRTMLSPSVNQSVPKSSTGPKLNVHNNNQDLHSLKSSSRANSGKESSSSVKRPSQIFRQQLLEQSLSMSLAALGSNNLTTSIKSVQDVPKSANRQLTRVNSKRKRSSISPPGAKRTSQMFRQRLLEQSLSMSFADPRSTNLPQSKLPTRRLPRKIRDREITTEKTNKGYSPALEEPKVNVLLMPKILDTEELSKKVKQEMQKQARLQPPQPPPRQMTHNSLSPSSTPTLPRSRCNTPSEMKVPGSLPLRSVTPISPRSVSIERPPFQTHLSRHSIMKVPFPMALRVSPMF